MKEKTLNILPIIGIVILILISLVIFISAEPSFSKNVSLINNDSITAFKYDYLDYGDNFNIETFKTEFNNNLI